MAYPKWSKEEDAMVAALYPDLGAKGTTEELRKSHFLRTAAAVKERAKTLGVKRDTKSTPRIMDGAWSDEELAIITDEYPTGGSERVKKVLSRKGYDRTLGAITTRASMLGLKTKNTKRRMTKGGDKVQINLCMDTVLDKEVIDKLDSQRNRSEYVRSLIRKDMGK